MHNRKPDTILTFDVETLPNYHPYPAMACAASEHASYASHGLKETDDPEHLILMGDKTTPRIIVGHNVSYDRQRILEEYSLESTQTCFLDTVSLYVALISISSHQRPTQAK